MSSEVSIRATNLGKAYNIYEKPEHRLWQIFWRHRRTFYKPFWAVQAVNLTVCQGETIGIVGRNGSGKSTLLELITGVLTPSSGDVEINGRVAALLELGAGFNPEFTGRENVYLNASVLGLKEAEITAKFSEIEDFARIGQFMDQPVRLYSSGMFARLAFAVAINVDPDILVIDEVLAVGDESFQRRCFQRLYEMQERGVTILLVSHAADTVIELCNRALLIDRGECLLIDAPKVVVSHYQSLIYADQDDQEALRETIQNHANTGILNGADDAGDVEETNGVKPDVPVAVAVTTARPSAYYDPQLIPESTKESLPCGARISNARIVDDDGQMVNVLAPGGHYKYCYEVLFDKLVENVRFGMLIKTTTGVPLGGMASHGERAGIASIKPGHTVSVEFKFHNYLTPGSYFLNAGVLGIVDGEDDDYLHRVFDILMIKIDRISGYRATGYVDFSPDQSCHYTILGTA